MFDLKHVFFLLLTVSLVSSNKKLIKFLNNGFTNVVVGIHPDVPETADLVQSIKNMMIDASAALYRATKKRAYFKEVTILVPKTWTETNYPSATDENFKAADIRIVHGGDDTPVCFQYQGCGLGGTHIQLTEAYMLDIDVASDYGDRGKTLVHEWGHCRWGLFDEYPYNDTNDKQFYLDSKGTIQATRCSLGIQGVLRERSTWEECIPDKKTRLPGPGCLFVTNGVTQPIGVKTSMMYRQFINEVETFCNDEPNDPLNNHNKEAKNRHNRLCNGRSTWSVIMDSPDFLQDSINKPNPFIASTVPTFKVLTSQKKRVVLVMDSSGSMGSDGKLNALRKAARSYLLTISSGTSVGLVRFASGASIVKQLTEVNDADGSRDSLISLLSTSVGGNTAIGRGILAGIQVLSNNGQDPKGGQILVLTDGEENVEPFVDEVAEDALKKGVKLQTIFFGLTDVNTDASLVQLSSSSGGDWYFASDQVNSGSGLSNIFLTLASSDDGDIGKELVQILSRSWETFPDVTYSSTVAIDGSVGLRTLFIFSWSEIEPRIELESPESICIFSNKIVPGKTYCANNDLHDVDRSFGTITFTIPGKAKAGIWKYSITSAFEDIITISVTSFPSDINVYPITIEAESTLLNVSGIQTAVVIAKVFQNSQPVLGASVTATVIRPTGTVSEITLLDNGASSDLEDGDGVYSRYFFDFDQRGRYFVKVDVFKDGKEPAGVVGSVSGSDIDPGYISGDGTFIPNPRAENIIRSVDRTGVAIDGALQRTVSTTGLAYTGQISSQDIWPPSKITDLGVEQVDLDDASAGITITFTSPGDDFDFGRASMYEMRFTFNNSYDLITEFSKQSLVTDEYVTEGNLSNLKPAMETENFTITLLSFPNDTNSVRISLAIRAYDEVNNSAEISNIASTVFFIEPPPIPTIPPESTLPFGDKFWYFVGGLIGGVVLLVIFVIVCCLCWGKRR